MEDTTMLAALTCGLPCWMAEQDVCRGSCGGRNHGLMRRGGEQPERTKHHLGRLYTLVAITDYMEADKMVSDDYGSWLRNVGYGKGKSYPHERIIKNMATPSQLKWSEVRAVDVGLDRWGRPEDKHLVWEKVGVPRTW